jgi:hypothetical protein
MDNPNSAVDFAVDSMAIDPIIEATQVAIARPRNTVVIDKRRNRVTGLLLASATSVIAVVQNTLSGTDNPIPN